MTRPDSFSAEKRVKQILNASAKVHNVSVEDILEQGNRASKTEVQRAKTHFRYILSKEVGLREAARLIGCVPATVYYSRKSHQRQYGNDFYYTELFNEIKKRI